MAKIAVELESALAAKAASGADGNTTGRFVAAGEGWSVSDVLCTCGPRDRAFEEQHSNYAIAMVLAGTFRYRSQSRRGLCNELMTPGSIFLGNAGQYFECGHEHSAGDRCLSFQFAPEYFERLVSDIGRTEIMFPVLRLAPHRDLSPTVARASADLAAKQERLPVVWEELGIKLAAQIVQHADGRCQVERGAPSPSAVRGVARTVRWIESHSESTVTLREMARLAGLSPYHFLRTFEQVAGLTPHQYVRRVRLREAAIRLATEPAKVLDIALDCGFGDASNFNRAFRGEFGMTPRGYRLHSWSQNRTSQAIVM